MMRETTVSDPMSVSMSEIETWQELAGTWAFIEHAAERADDAKIIAKAQQGRKNCARELESLRAR